MSQKCIKLIIILSLMLILSSMVSAKGELNYILPIDNSHIGLEYKYYLDESAPFLKGVYDWSEEEVLYQAGMEFYLQDKKCSVSYINWNNHSLPGYRIERGFKGNINIPINYDRSFDISTFYGKSDIDRGKGQSYIDLRKGKTELEQAKYRELSYLNLKYTQNFYFTMDKYMDLNLSALLGFDRDGDSFSVYKMMIPISYNDIKVISRLGYINQSSRIKSYYSLNNILKGYNNIDLDSRDIGMVSITIEKQKVLFPDHKQYYMTLLKGAVFFETGDTISDGENIADIDLKRSAGLGLIYNLGTVDIRLDGLVISEDNWSDFKTEFSVAYAF